MKRKEEHCTVIAVRVTFKGKSALENAKHIEALLKLLEERAYDFKLSHIPNYR
jgi:hypothetical protein